MAASDARTAFVRSEDAPLMPAPANVRGLRGWLIPNLFSSPLNSVLTLFFGTIALWLIWNIVDWAFLRATWTGADGTACTWEGAGACWPLIVVKFPQWIYGFFPIDQRWRVNLSFVIGIAALVPMMMPSVAYKAWNGLFLLLAYPLITLILLTGGNFQYSLTIYAVVIAILLAFGIVMAALAARSGEGFGSLRIWAYASAFIVAAMALFDFDFGMVPVETSNWGGLTVTLIVALTGMVASLPLGVLLALGRRSNMPVVRIFSVIFIELWRGVPLITVLFMSSVMLPLFLPAGMNFDKLLRALIGVALFTAAYMAETVRGGLQAIPKGQYEGAQALGLSYWQMMNKIILPQALKVSIPNIVSSFIALFKDTTLVAIIGLFDLLGIMRTGLKETIWASPSATPTAYLTMALVFWVFCFGMSRYSIYTERRLNTGHKR